MLKGFYMVIKLILMTVLKLMLPSVKAVAKLACAA